ncbi:Peptidoglycan/LPS O-acetylase OafA/YrhL, contains acyltransferase and SGNH-hydrolase domains [Desulfomicrobium norvegicum]|uniref:Peptidoglycan/LPS O-acetylase OafA/YrhL, contains acyltransferase and SGNH-hydrolase domains n=1 Tax=Desulfomicrobium norvegicum (strain DSM 1741 / NCIMB 8310) TaxID=52561 RepID=A0A8G2F7Q3_DESNO|nr:acyltransferase [Desulfomicrobium norvegicum]SFL62894.1 Peptidoglycan/LPS O-acetylase OafA/YrhL, contains acyltransferase and SGNH-hydrolase domains [Desulfomicrobium norvegicum]
MHLRSFEYFRAVAIVLIVIGHCYGITGWVIDSFGERVLANLISGGTSLFVFISGFLFHHVFYPKFVYRKFLEKKFKNVYVPYLILSVLPVIWALVIKAPFPEFYFGPEATFYDQIVRPTLLYYWYGGVMVYWYIPFIMAMFIISPLFIWFIRIDLRKKIYIISILSLISILMHRPVNNWSIVQSVIYFSPVYMFGILCSMERDFIYDNFKGKDFHLLGCVIFLALVQAAFFEASGNLQKNPFEFNWIDIAFIQKQILCVYFMVFLHKYEHIDSTLLKTLAGSSFAIYFLHGWIIYLISTVQSYYRPYYGLHLLPILSPLVIWASYAVAKRVKRAFPNKSRMLIGW